MLAGRHPNLVLLVSLIVTRYLLKMLRPMARQVVRPHYPGRQKPLFMLFNLFVRTVLAAIR